LYGALSRLERRGWVRPVASGERRRPYEITAAGQEILAEQVTTMQQIVRVARLRTAPCSAAPATTTGTHGRSPDLPQPPGAAPAGTTGQSARPYERI
jgi:hypothetical protein